MIIATSARAGAPAPLVTPLADTDVTYDIAGAGGKTLGQRMRWRADGWLQRIDPGDSATYMLTDYRAGMLTVVDVAHHARTSMAVPMVQFAPPGVPGPGKWTRGAEEEIAGASCTDWTGQDSDGHETVFCYTSDGVLLAASRGGKTFLRATTLSHAPVSEKIFILPKGFHEIAPKARPR